MAKAIYTPLGVVFGVLGGLLGGAVNAVNLLTSGTCDGFLAP